MSSTHLNKNSEQLLLHVKMKKDSKELQQQLSKVKIESLQKGLDDDNNKKAFWINIYNAYYQILRVEKNLVKPEIYKNKAFSIAGVSLSLDDVEHGILRRFRYKYSLGYFANLFVSKFVRKNAVDKLDYRIHFALNCGAKSCPPIAFYNPERLDTQLNIATQSFLEGETDFDDVNKVVNTTALFQWFQADFGGKNGITKIYAEHLNKDISGYKIKYKKYSWDEDLANFSE